GRDAVPAGLGHVVQFLGAAHEGPVPGRVRRACGRHRLSSCSSGVLKPLTAATVTVRPVDRERALDQLPPGYARALRLADAGRPVADIAADLGIDPDAVTALLEIGAEKLAKVMAQDPPQDDPAGGTGP